MPTLQDVREKLAIHKFLTSKVNEKYGIKGTELIVEFVSAHMEGKLEPNVPHDLVVDYTEELNELVQQGDLVEIEVVLPDSAYRARSMYFPRGTEITVVLHANSPKN